MRFYVALGLGLAVLSASRPVYADDRASLQAALHIERLTTYRIAMVTKHGAETTVQDLTILDRGRQADYLPQMRQTDVTVGNRMWIRKDDGTWSGPADLPPNAGGAFFQRAERVRRWLARSTVTSLGAGVLGGVQVAHFRIVTVGRISHRSMTTDLWLGVADGFPRCAIMTQGGDTISGTFSAFGQRLSIPTPP